MSYYKDLEKENIIKLRELISTLPPFCNYFFKYLDMRATSKTKLAYAYDLHVFFNFLKEKNPSVKEIKDIKINLLDKLQLLDFEEYIEYLKLYKGKNDKEISNTELGIKRKLASLKSFFNYNYKFGLIENNTAFRITMPKIRDKEIIRMEIDEVAKFLDNVESGENLTNKEKSYHKLTKTRDFALLSLMLGTGLRVSETVGINISDIDFNIDAIKIVRKGGKEVLIYFSDEIEKALKAYLDDRKNIVVKNDEDEDALFLSIQNKRITVRSVEKLVKKYASITTPLKHITPHKLRSTYGTNLYKETGDIYLVADVLGHNDVNTTKKHYAAIEDERRRSARNAVKLRDT